MLNQTVIVGRVTTNPEIFETGSKSKMEGIAEFVEDKKMKPELTLDNLLIIWFMKCFG